MELLPLVNRYVRERPLRPVTAAQYCWVVERFVEVAQVQHLSAINRDVVLRWREREIVRGLSAVSWNAYVRYLRAVVNFAIQELDWEGANPFYRCKLPEPRRPKRTVSDKGLERARSVLGFYQQQAEWQTARDRFAPSWFWRVLLETVVYTGMRLRQVVELKWGDLNLVALTIRLRSESSKTRREWDIPLAEDLLPYLQKLLQETERARLRDPLLSEQVFDLALFVEGYSGALSDRKVIQFFERLSGYAGCAMSVHRFRHTLATALMAEPFRNVQLVQAILGHADVRTTLEYVTPDMDAMRELLNRRGAPLRVTDAALKTPEGGEMMLRMVKPHEK